MRTYHKVHGQPAFESAACAEPLPYLLDAAEPDLVAGDGVGDTENLLELPPGRRRLWVSWWDSWGEPPSSASIVKGKAVLWIGFLGFH
jgi:hypothetical protein